MNIKSVQDPMYVLIRDVLIEEIKDGKWPSDKPMDPESVLMERYKASRGTVRRAFDELVTAGWVIRKPGKGTFVRSVNTSNFPLTTRPIIQSASFSANVPGAVTQLLKKQIYPNTEGEICDSRVIEAFGCDQKTKIVLIKRLRIGPIGPWSIQSAYLLEEQFPDLYGYDEKDLSSLGKIYQENGRFITKGTEQLYVTSTSPEQSKLLKMKKNEKYIIHRERHSFDQNGQLTEVLIAIDHLLRYHYKYEFVQDMVFENITPL